MRQKAKDTERYAVSMDRTIKGIEEAASKAYEKDRTEQEGHASSSENRYQKNWVFHEESGYYYNALYGWYYDVSSKMYYGGNPPEWTHTPNIPSAVYYGAVNPQSDPLLQAVTHPDGKQAEEVSKNKYPVGMKVRKVHPLAGIGGYQMPLEGTFGAGHAPHADSVEDDETKKKKKTSTKNTSVGTKRKSGGGKEKETAMSAKEREFLAKREAAQKRVQKRTMEAFGLK